MRKNDGIRKSFGKHHNNNCFRQESSLEASGWKFEEKQNIGTVSKYLPTSYFLITKGKLETLQWRNLADTAFNQRIKVNTTSHGTTGQPESPGPMPWEGHAITHVPATWENTREIPNEGCSTKVTGHSFKKVNVIKHKDLGTVPRLKKTKETWRLNVAQDLGSLEKTKQGLWITALSLCWFPDSDYRTAAMAKKMSS